MNTFTLRIFLFWAFSLLGHFPGFAGCIDFVGVKVKPVQCFGMRNGEIQVKEVVGGQTPYWYSLDDTSNWSTRPVFDLLHPGVYLLFVRDANGCVWSDIVEVPEPEFLQVKLLPHRLSIESGEPLYVTAEVAPGTTGWKSLEWRPPALFPQQNSLVQTLYPMESVTLAIEFRDSNNCIARDHVEIEVKKTAVYFPNVIRPGSNQNAYFTAFAGDGVTNIVQLQVYARNGALLFDRHNLAPNDPINGWNGRTRGRTVQPDSYLWIAIIDFRDGRREQFHGSVTVVE